MQTALNLFKMVNGLCLQLIKTLN